MTPQPTLTDLHAFAAQKRDLGQRAAALYLRSYALYEKRKPEAFAEANRLRAEADALGREWLRLDEGRQMEVYDWSTYLVWGLELPEGRRGLYTR